MTFAFLLAGCAHERGVHDVLARKAFTFVDVTIPVRTVVACRGAACDELVKSQTLETSGSGVVIANSRASRDIKYVLTAGHVCTVAEDVKAFVNDIARMRGYDRVDIDLSQRIEVVNSSGESYPTKVVGLSRKHDVCVLVTTGIDRDVRPMKLARRGPRVGEYVWNIAAPMGSWQPGMMHVFDGIYSGPFICDVETANAFPIPCTPGEHAWDVYTLPVAGGSSGSPILNSDGRIVGIVSMGSMRFPHIAYSPTHGDIEMLVDMVVQLDRRERGKVRSIDFDSDDWIVNFAVVVI